MAASNAQVQAFVDQRVRVRCEAHTLLAVMVTQYSDTALTIATARPMITWSNLP